MDRTHVESFANWCKDKESGRVGRREVEMFQQGEWQGEVVRRRKGRGDVVPLKYGGPVGVGLHSWFVRKVFGIRVYEDKNDE